MKILHLFFSLFALLAICSCSTNTKTQQAKQNIRPVVDTVGFAHLDWQMDSIVSRISTQFGEELAETAQPENTVWRTAICPHDDYAYAGWLYPAVLKNLKAKTLIIFGVAHKARNFQLENQLVFDSFDAWQGPYGTVKVSPIREQLMEKMPDEYYVVHDSMQLVEQSIESMIPFLQHQNKATEIVSVLVPYMEKGRMNSIAESFAAALKDITSTQQLEWGKDIALLITTDAVHYGCEEWGGNNYARFGCDSIGYEKAMEYEHEIIANCFTGDLSNDKTDQFINYTVQADNFKEYKWTWCGRYSVPMGLKVANRFQQLTNAASLEGIPLAYETTISHPEIPVQDLKMGKTAIATTKHWVGLAAIGFK
ncbi:AmmeMemoRadiSam system protein B [uncultured Draconibacterium sp.]|uniref:AmmeMemoRadiSam system protein B n=1 Tax=uncultured Draconibacterium sp. TaxID=1573823 RepID=UPI0025DFA1BB|nr:AmmeMemoRadiSam system protein B [uncultured Draconibacterium sp.]